MYFMIYVFVLLYYLLDFLSTGVFTLSYSHVFSLSLSHRIFIYLSFHYLPTIQSPLSIRYLYICLSILQPSETIHRPHEKKKKKNRYTIDRMSKTLERNQ